MSSSQSQIPDRPNKPPRTHYMSNDSSVTQRDSSLTQRDSSVAQRQHRESPSKQIYSSSNSRKRDGHTNNTMSSPHKMFTDKQSIHHIDDEEVEEVSVATEPCSSV